jgi:hypothetical protein
MLHCVVLVRTDVSEELSASFINTKCPWYFFAGVVPGSPILVTLMIEALNSFQHVGSYKSHTV